MAAWTKSSVGRSSCTTSTAMVPSPTKRCSVCVTAHTAIVRAIYKMTGQMVKLPEDEDTPEKRVDKIFRVMDVDKNSECMWQSLFSIIRRVQGRIEAGPLDRAGALAVRWSGVKKATSVRDLYHIPSLPTETLFLDIRLDSFPPAHASADARSTRAGRHAAWTGPESFQRSSPRRQPRLAGVWHASWPH